MYYGQKFKKIATITVIENILSGLIFTFFVGAAAAAVIYTIRDTEGILRHSIETIVGGFWQAIVSVFTGGILGMVLAIALIVLGFVLIIPVAFYAMITYIVDVIYIIHMYRKEKKGELEGKEEECLRWEEVVPKISLGITLAVCAVALIIYIAGSL